METSSTRTSLFSFKATEFGSAALGGRLFEGDFCATHPGQLESCIRLADCSARVLWRAIQAAVDDVLKRTTLQDLLFDEQQMFIHVKRLRESTATIAWQ